MVRSVLPLSMPQEVGELIKKAEEVARREGKKWNLSGLLAPGILETLKKYIQHHGDGNPATTIIDYINNPDFQATPMLFRSPEEIRAFMQQIRNTNRWPELQAQLQTWINIFNEEEKRSCL